MAKVKKPLNPALVFIIKFLLLFIGLYGFYLAYLGVVSPGGYYIQFLDEHLNFITGLRHVLIAISSAVLNFFGFGTKTNDVQLLVVGHNILHIGYDCLGIGVMCFFTAFVIAYPAKLKSKILFDVSGLIVIQALNITRFVLLGLYWKHTHVFISDHHTIFNIVVYLIIGISLYFYIRYQDKTTALHAANRSVNV